MVRWELYPVARLTCVSWYTCKVNRQSPPEEHVHRWKAEPLDRKGHTAARGSCPCPPKHPAVTSSGSYGGSGAQPPRPLLVISPVPLPSAHPFLLSLPLSSHSLGAVVLGPSTLDPCPWFSTTVSTSFRSFPKCSQPLRTPNRPRQLMCTTPPPTMTYPPPFW